MHRWKLSALAAAASVTVALTSTNAAALALGPISVKSALGEPLRAEIALVQATETELDTLAASIAPGAVYRAQGMDYSEIARAVRVQLNRSARTLYLSSDIPVKEPFLDLVVETQWGSGHLVRSYTLLLDPPTRRRQEPVPITAPQLPTPSRAAPPVQRSVPSQASSAASTASASSEDTVRVRSGDTAWRIANAHRQAGVSLDQMLVAMLRSNPHAFFGNNVNRMRAGAVLDIPSAEVAQQTSAAEARQIVAAQSRDFNAYRLNLASKTQQATVQAADRSDSGRLQAQVTEANQPSAATDKLTLSKGDVQSTAAEAQLAAQKQANEQATQLSQLQRNLDELEQLAQEATTIAPASATIDASASSLSVPSADTAPSTDSGLLAVETGSMPTTEQAAETPSNESANTAPDETAANAQPTEPAAPVKTPAVSQTPAEEEQSDSSWISSALLPTGAVLLAGLLGFLGYTRYKRRKAGTNNLAFNLEDSQLQADSFYGSSGGQKIDTDSTTTKNTITQATKNTITQSTMTYSASQLDGGADVDPVAEADVYLAYGRDVQAEEILKEALRTQPGRLSIYVKLAEVYSKRQDISALENLARNMEDITHEANPEYQRVLEIGRSLAPSNALFATAATGSAAMTSLAASTFADSSTSEEVSTPSAAGALSDFMTDHTQTPAEEPIIPAEFETSLSATQFDLPSSLDKDDSINLDAPTSDSPVMPTLIADTVQEENDSTYGDALQGLDFNLSAFDNATPATPASNKSANLSSSDDGLEFDLNPSTFSIAESQNNVSTASPQTTDDGLEFDVSSLEFDLSASAESAATFESMENTAHDPLATKLALAQEFHTIGDSEGARDLIEEVLAEATGSLKERAQKMLSELN